MKAKTPSKSSNGRVRETTVLELGAPSAIASAFKTPVRPPAKLESLTPRAKKQLVARLIPRPEPALTPNVAQAIKALEPPVRRFHGTKVPLSWFPPELIDANRTNTFGYMFAATVRNATKLPFNVTTQALLTQLGNLMGDAGRDAGADSIIPAGYTYFGQFVDHDITLDVSSSIDAPQDAHDDQQHANARARPRQRIWPRTSASIRTSIHFRSGGDPSDGGEAADRPDRGHRSGRTANAANGPVPAPTYRSTSHAFDQRERTPSSRRPTVRSRRSSATRAMMKTSSYRSYITRCSQFHNRVVDLLVTAAFPGDIFAEAKKIVTHHYQWCVVHDFLSRICGVAAINARNRVGAGRRSGSQFNMPAEFAMAAYRFGHSMIRNGYVLTFVVARVRQHARQCLRLHSSPAPPGVLELDRRLQHVLQHGPSRRRFLQPDARTIDSVLANGLEGIPGGSGIMAVLAARNLRRGLAMGLPSGQGCAARALRLTPLTAEQLTSGLARRRSRAPELQRRVAAEKTPLWYYVLREAMVTQNGNQLGPLGGRIVAETFVRMLKRDRRLRS